jgi:adenylate cyclase
VEIERKFLVDRLPDDLERHEATRIEQGYLAIEPDGGEVRVRRRGDEATLTVKRGRGQRREEVEVELPGEAFARLWPLTEGRRVEKTRHLIALGERTVELDVYAGALAGLAVAEVEFDTPEEADAFAAPAWLGREVTDDPRFKNQALATDGAPDGSRVV